MCAWGCLVMAATLLPEHFDGFASGTYLTTVTGMVRVAAFHDNTNQRNRRQSAIPAPMTLADTQARTPPCPHNFH